jgi:hypothetical protein
LRIAVSLNEYVAEPARTLITVSPREPLWAAAWIGIVVTAGPIFTVPAGSMRPALFGVASMVALTVVPSLVFNFSGTEYVRPRSGAMRKPSPTLLPFT